MKRWVRRTIAATSVAAVSAAAPVSATAITPSPDDLAARLAVQADAAKLADRASERAPKSFAGLYIARGGTIKVGFTRNAETNLAELKRAARFPGRLRAFRADYTSAELRAVHRRLSAALDELQQEGLGARTVSTAIARNRVQVGVTRLSEANRRAIARRFGGAVEPVSLKTVAPTSRGFSYPPLKGGLTIDSPQGLTSYRCTSAFVASGGGSDYLLTAGHCGPVNSGWLHGSVFIGRMTGNSFRNGSSADAGKIQIRPTDRSNLVYISDSNLRPIRAVNFSDVVGSSICMSGNTSGYVCGTIRSTDFTADYGAVTIYRQRTASFPARAGDSGGPVFAANSAYGIISGNATYSDGNQDAIYSNIQLAQQALGVNVRTCCR